MWLEFNDNRAAYRGDDPDARWRAMQAESLSELPRRTILTHHAGRQIRGARVWEGSGLGADLKSIPWRPGQWANILEQAARLVEKGEPNCTSLEYWMWWCYPIFQRYGWNTREVQEAAIKRGLAEAGEMYEANFRAYLMRRGLRIVGKKQRRDRTPPLAEFVHNVQLPDPHTVREVTIWA